MKKFLFGIILSFLVMLSLVSGALANQDSSTRIINGSVPYNMKDWNYMVSLVDSSSGQVFCSGALIHPRWVLTAGHCLQQDQSILPPERISLTLGQKNIFQTKGFMWAEQTLVHPGFSYRDQNCILFICWGDGVDGNIENDLGLIKLASPAPKKSIVYLAGSRAGRYFPRYRDNLREGHPMTVHIGGYGVTCSASDCKTSGLFHQATTSLVGNDECNTVFSNTPSSRGIICLRGHGQNICSGDSGSPVMLRRHKSNRPMPGKGLVIGVASFSACGAERYDGAFHTKPYYSWIYQQISGKGLQ